MPVASTHVQRGEWAFCTVTVISEKYYFVQSIVLCFGTQSGLDVFRVENRESSMAAGMI